MCFFLISVLGGLQPGSLAPLGCAPALHRFQNVDQTQHLYTFSTHRGRGLAEGRVAGGTTGQALRTQTGVAGIGVQTHSVRPAAERTQLHVL